MAMAASQVVSAAAAKSRDLLIQETRFLLGVKPGIDQLRDDLNRLRGMISYLETRHETDDCFRNMKAEAWDVFRTGEDIIDEYVVEVARRNGSSGRQILKAGVTFFTQCVFVKLHRVGSLIHDFRPRFCSITATIEDFVTTTRRTAREGSESSRGALRKVRRRHNPPPSYAHVDETCDGRVDSVKGILRELLKSKNSRVVSIFGMGGLGKTVIAKKVLSHPEVLRQFDCFSWVCLSGEYTARDVVEQIVADLLPKRNKEIAEMGEKELFQMLYRVQKEKRCLVVLDDVWDTRNWDNIRAAFPIKKSSLSKLLIVTRNREISRYVDPGGFVHKLRLLSEDESFELLKRKTDGISMDIKMEKSAREMLQHCGGLPMAISILSSILLMRKTPSEWEAARRNICFHLTKERSDLFKSFARSYDDLPYELKPHFLYLGIFPEGAEVSVRKLIQIWTGEDLSSFQDLKADSIEVEVDQILRQLVERDMIHVVQKDKSTRHIKTCRLHNLMREFCISVAKEESFYKVINLGNKDELGHCSSSYSGTTLKTGKIRRLSVLLDDDFEGEAPLGEELEDERGLSLRTLLVFPETERKLFPEKGRNWDLLKPIIKHHRFLRVMDLEGFKSMDGIVPRSIGHLDHLRFLSFKNSHIGRLPSSIWYLKSTQTLDLRGTSSPTTPIILPNLPPGRKMDQLRHLYLPCHFSTDEGKKLRLSGFRNLQTLKNFSPTQCEERDLPKLTHLRKLTSIPS